MVNFLSSSEIKKLHITYTYYFIIHFYFQNVQSGFVGCLKEMRERRATIGKWSKNPKDGVIPCSEKVEPGYFFGANGGYLLAQRRYRVGLDFDITMQIKPRNISGMMNYGPNHLHL